MRTIIASLSIFYFAFLKAFIVSDRNLTRREYAVYSAVSFVLVLMLWLVFVGTVSDIAKENGWALMPDFIEELYSPWERTFGMILIGALLAQGSSSKTPVTKPGGTKMFRSVFLNDARRCCFLSTQW